MFEKSQYKIQLENDGRISFYCQDSRLISEYVPDEYKDFAYKHITPEQFVDILEKMTAAYWQKGVNDGRDEVVAMLNNLKEKEQKILARDFNGEKWW
ncbi:MAG: hypothetical protein FWB73_00255 [Treponema sp.]|nr:hypothetical protein [Treponema sp.]